MKEICRGAWTSDNGYETEIAKIIVYRYNDLFESRILVDMDKGWRQEDYPDNEETENELYCNYGLIYDKTTSSK